MQELDSGIEFWYIFQGASADVARGMITTVLSDLGFLVGYFWLTHTKWAFADVM